MDIQSIVRTQSPTAWARTTIRTTEPTVTLGALTVHMAELPAALDTTLRQEPIRGPSELAVEPIAPARVVLTIRTPGLTAPLGRGPMPTANGAARS